jgi:cellulose synthase/poly-beta-1,6-N-acetylglucosamine synthase-like glycosyltransferase
MISVIIPAYNSEKTLPYTLRSLQNQTLPRKLYEVIVVDDASTDGTGSVAREFGVRYRRQNKEGPAAARNFGVRIARGDVVLFTDSDCIPREDWIEKMVQPFEDPKVAGVMGRYLTRQKEYAARFVQLEFEERFNILKKADNIDLVPSFAAAFRREVFEEVGGFDAHYPLANNEDVELSYKIASRGYKMVFSNDAIVYHRHPATWKKYISIKFSRAFWRILVYKKFPGKIVKDAYTPQSLKLQIATAWMFTFSPIIFFFGAIWGALAMGVGLLLFLASCLPFIVKTYPFDPQLAMAAPFILYPKGMSFGLGILLGLIIGGERDTFFPVALAVTDGLTAAVALTLGFFVRSELYGTSMVFSKPIEYFYPLLVIYPLLIIVTFRQMGLYQVKTCLSKVNQVMLFIKAFFVVALILMAGMFILKMNYSRTLLGVVFATSIVLMSSTRLIMNMIHERMLAQGVNATRVLIVGCGETAQMLLEKAHSFPSLGYHVVGFIAEAGIGKKYLGKEILGRAKDLLKIIEEHQVDDVIFARPSISRQEVLDLIVKLEEVDVGVKMISDLYEIVTSQTVIDGIADIPMVEIHNHFSPQRKGR